MPSKLLAPANEAFVTKAISSLSKLRNKLQSDCFSEIRSAFFVLLSVSRRLIAAVM